MDMDNELAQKHRVITLSSPVTRDWLDKMRTRTTLLALDSLEPINVLIDCNGGNARCGFYGHDWLMALPCPVHTYAVGNCGSAALDIFLAGEKRFSLPRSVFLIHNACMNVELLPADQDLYPRRLKERMREIKRLNKSALELYVRRSNLSKKRVRKIMDQGDQIFRDIDASQMLAWGFLDEIVTKIPW
jgi:ATP-dependent protease ClpP protease subunit